MQSTKRLAPAFSMGQRIKPMKSAVKDGPGPSEYRPMHTLRRAPTHHIGKRFGSRRKDRVPGPGRYVPEKTMEHTLKSAPAFTMRRRTQSAKSLLTPGPIYNANKIGMMDRAPAFTMRKKYGSSLDNTAVAPGPGKYRPEDQMKEITRRAPAFSMRQKLKRSQSAGAIFPGPGSHDPSKAQSHIQSRAAAYTMGIRFKDLRRFSVPGPGAHAHVGGQQLGVMKTAPTFSMRKKLAGAKGDVVPGAGKYVPDKARIMDRAPAFTMRSKCDVEFKSRGSNPAANAYNPTLKFKAKRAASYSMRHRPKAKGTEGRPAPNHYKPNYAGSRRSAAYSIGKRFANRGDGTIGPGPAYTIKSKMGEAPKFSMRQRPRPRRKTYTPAANAYNASASKLKMMERSAAFTMRKRVGVDSKFKTPGPKYELGGQFGYRS